MNPAIEVLGDLRCQLGECPVWSVAEQALYWVDIEGRRVHRLAWPSRTLRTWRTAERIGSIALHREGGLLAAMESGIFHLQLPGGDDGHGECNAAAALLHRAPYTRADMRFNDGRCDRAGRFWVSSMVRDTKLGDPSGALFRVDARGLSAPVVEGLITGNGLGFSPDGRTMYLSDSHPSAQCVWAFDLDADGALRNRRTFVDMHRYPGRPDGAAVDAEGCYWSCATDAGQLHRFRPDGTLERSLTLPVAKPTMCAFGGPDLDLLFIASLQPAAPIDGFDPALAGALLLARPGVRGLAEAAFDPRA